MVLRMALAAYKNEAVAKGLGPQGILNEAEALAVLKRLVKSREDSVEQFGKAGFPERAAVEQAWFERRPLVVDYRGSDGALTHRTVRLERIVMDRGETRLNVVDEAKGAARQLLLHRIERAVVA